MTLVATRKALVDWSRAATGYDAGHVIWADQNMPKPTKPYLALKLKSFKQDNHVYIGAPNVSGVSVLSVDKEFTLSINAYGTTNAAPVDTLLALQSSLSKVSTYAILTAKDIAFVDTLFGPEDVSDVLDTDFEPRGLVDFLMRIPWEDTDTGVNVIEEPIIDATVKNLEGIDINNSQIIVST